MKWRRRIRYYILIFLRLRDMPTKVGLGFALGSTMNFFPTFGLGPAIGVFLAGLFRLNLVAAFIGHMILTPFFPILFYINLWVGRCFVSGEDFDLEIATQQIMALNKGVFIELGRAFTIGAVISSLVTFVFFSIVIYYLFSRYRYDLVRILLERFPPSPKA